MGEGVESVGKGLSAPSVVFEEITSVYQTLGIDPLEGMFIPTDAEGTEHYAIIPSLLCLN